MIKSATVKNYILIDDITLELDKGFNVLTGETGAGKSIITGAIDAVFGAKANKEVIKTGADKAYIELLIKLKPSFDKNILTDNGIEVFDDEIIISREIFNSTSRFRINGVLVTQEFIKEIREKFLDIHTQHQNYNYLQQKNHITLLDNFALKQHRDNVETYRKKFIKYTSLAKRLEKLTNEAENKRRQEDFLRFQIKEIEDTKIEDINEDEKLGKELDILANIEKLKELSYSSYQALNGDGESIISALGVVKNNLSKLSAMDETTLQTEEEFTGAYEILKETARQMLDYSENKENDNERMEYISERIDRLEKIKRKYGSSLEEVLNTYEQLSQELSSIEVSQDEIVKTEKEIKVLKSELDELSKIISKTRKETANVLSEAVEKKLEHLELAKSKFKTDVAPAPMSENGTDRVEFMISTNVSEDVKPLAKTASGGEISRVMLALKSIFAQADKTNTVIFDEIDTGISGKASQAVADELTELAKSHQIIVITHQPIIAAKADAHFYVTKEQTDKTKINVYKLNGENRIKAIALLASGGINSESENFAKTLLGL